MRKENGFTLIELLAVIVILAVIALIATPLVMDTIEDAKNGALKSTARNIIEIAETEYQKKLIDDPDQIPNIDFDSLNYKGEKVDGISGSFNEDGTANIAISKGDKCVSKTKLNQDVVLETGISKADCLVKGDGTLPPTPPTPEVSVLDQVKEKCKNSTDTGEPVWVDTGITIQTPNYPKSMPECLNQLETRIFADDVVAVKVELSEFFLEMDTFCRFDYATLMDQQNKSYQELCGVRKGESYLIPGNQLNVKVWSDYQNSYSGVSMKLYTTTSCSVLKDLTEPLSSDQYSHTYVGDNTKVMEYEIELPDNVESFKLYYVYYYNDLKVNSQFSPLFSGCDGNYYQDGAWHPYSNCQYDGTSSQHNLKFKAYLKDGTDITDMILKSDSVDTEGVYRNDFLAHQTGSITGNYVKIVIDPNPDHLDVTKMPPFKVSFKAVNLVTK